MVIPNDIAILEVQNVPLQNLIAKTLIIISKYCYSFSSRLTASKQSRACSLSGHFLSPECSLLHQIIKTEG